MFAFKDIIGQEAVIDRLRQEIAEGRIPHARLFCGPAGVGKLSLALAYAKYICCDHPTADGEACDICPQCVKWNKLVHPDVHFVFPIVNKAKSPAVSVCNDFISQWRALLIKQPYFYLQDWLSQLEAENKQAAILAKESDEITRKLSLKASQGGYKICIVYLAEKMNEACSNKLLKLLEEPPERTLFLLTAEQPELLLPTIISRTQRINVPRINESKLGQSLVDNFSLSPAEAFAVAHMANGDYVKAMQAIHISKENELFFNLFVSLMRLAYQRKIREMKLWSEEVAAMGREKQKEFLTYCQRMVRENFIYNFQRKEMNYLTTPEQNFAVRFAPFINERNVMGMMDELSEAQLHIEQNVNVKMVFFDFALKMIMLLKS